MLREGPQEVYMPRERRFTYMFRGLTYPSIDFTSL
jgi:hypothetical protein